MEENKIDNIVLTVLASILCSVAAFAALVDFAEKWIKTKKK